MRKLIIIIATLAILAFFLSGVVIAQSPPAFEEIGRLTDYYDSLTVSEDGQLVAAGAFDWDANRDRVALIDISDLENPVEVGSIEMGDWVQGIALQGNYAYVVDRRGSRRTGRNFHVINIADPANPVEIHRSGRQVPDGAYGIFVYGNYAYIAAGLGGLCVIDISRPEWVGSPVCVSTPAVANSIFVAGAYAYVGQGHIGGAYQPGGLSIFDVHNPLTPRQISYLPEPQDVRDLQVVGKTAYLIGSDFTIVDLRDPRPRVSQVFPIWGSHIEIFGAYAWIASGGKLEVFGLRPPGGAGYSYSFGGLGVASEATVVERNGSYYAIIAASSGGLQIIRIGFNPWGLVEPVIPIKPPPCQASTC